MNGNHATPRFRKFHALYWLVAGVALFISGYSQSESVIIAGTRNLYLTVAGALASYLMLAFWTSLKQGTVRRSWLAFLAACYILGMILVVPINPVTYGQLGLELADLTWRHVFAGIMNFGFVMMFWGVLLMFLFDTDFRLPGMKPKPVLDQPGALEVETRNGTTSVPLNTITHIQAAADYIEVHTLDGKTWLKRSTIKSLLNPLEKQGFIQVHRSLVINSSALKAIEGPSKAAYTLVMKNGTRLKTSRRYKAAVETLLP